MGTEYEIYKNKKGIEISILEMSNRLELFYYEDDKVSIVLTEELNPKDMMKMFLKGITVCSYWMNSKEFNNTMKECFEEYSI
jgi:hypothetical protein